MSIEIRHQSPGRHLPVTMGAKYLRVGDYAIDVAARQQDQAVTIDLSLNAGGAVVEGVGAGWYVANVTLPPARYQEVETGETNPVTGAPVIRRERLPVDLNLVVVNLWALPPEQPQETLA